MISSNFTKKAEVEVEPEAKKAESVEKTAPDATADATK